MNIEKARIRIPRHVFYRHYKGSNYRVLVVAKSEKDGTPHVVYENQDGEVYTRPVAEWEDLVDYEGKFIQRFVRLPSHVCPSIWPPRDNHDEFKTSETYLLMSIKAMGGTYSDGIVTWVEHVPSDMPIAHMQHTHTKVDPSIINDSSNPFDALSTARNEVTAEILAWVNKHLTRALADGELIARYVDGALVICTPDEGQPGDIVLSRMASGPAVVDTLSSITDLPKDFLDGTAVPISAGLTPGKQKSRLERYCDIMGIDLEAQYQAIKADDELSKEKSRNRED